MQRCTHCGMETRNLATHRNRCVKDPVVRARIKAVLDDGAGRIIAQKQYRAVKQQPVSDVTLIKYFGSWGAVAAAFGLQWHGLRQRRMHLDAPFSEDETHWSECNPTPDEVCLHGYRVRYVQVTETIWHEYIALR